jgi:Tfp pilus assembly protein PilX
LRETLIDGRAAILDARLDIYSVNFGNASKHLEAARSALRAGESTLKDLGRQDDATEVGKALARIDEAQRMTGQLNQDANAVAADAAAAIGRVLDRTPR